MRFKMAPGCLCGSLSLSQSMHVSLCLSISISLLPQTDNNLLTSVFLDMCVLLTKLLCLSHIRSLSK